MYASKDIFQIKSIVQEIDSLHEYFSQPANKTHAWVSVFLDDLKRMFNKRVLSYDSVKAPERLTASKSYTPYKKNNTIKESKKLNDVDEYPEINETTEIVIIDEQDIHDHSPEIFEQTVVSSPEIKRTDYLYRLTADRNNLLTNFNISEEITEDNYTDILEEYREYLCSHEKRKQFEKLLRKRATLYKSNRSKSNKQYRM